MHVREFIEKNYPEYYSWNHYPADKTAAFCESKGDWGLFSNFAQTPLVVDGVQFYCAESLFQVLKFKDPEARKVIYSIKGQGLKMKAKHFEKTPGARSDWGEIFVDVLKFCIMTKFQQSQAFRDELEKSRGLYIVEDQSTFNKSADTYGAKLTPDGKEYSGPNLMGRLLMELRDERCLAYKLPDDLLSLEDLR